MRARSATGTCLNTNGIVQRHCRRAQSFQNAETPGPGGNLQHPRAGGPVGFTSGPKMAHFERVEWVTADGDWIASVRFNKAI
jgi:hypothetical protein